MPKQKINEKELEIKSISQRRETITVDLLILEPVRFMIEKGNLMWLGLVQYNDLFIYYDWLDGT